MSMYVMSVENPVAEPDYGSAAAFNLVINQGILKIVERLQYQTDTVRAIKLYEHRQTNYFDTQIWTRRQEELSGALEL